MSKKDKIFEISHRIPFGDGSGDYDSVISAEIYHKWCTIMIDDDQCARKTLVKEEAFKLANFIINSFK